MSRIKRFFQTALIYFAGNIFSKLVTFFLIPLYTNKLLPSEYGDYDLVITIITLFVAVAFFQIWDGMFRFSFDSKDEEEKYNIVCDTIYFYLVGIIFYAILFFVTLSILKFNNWIYAFVFGIIYGLQYVYSFIARAFLKNELFVFSGTVNTLIVALSNIAFICYFDLGVASLYLAQIAGCGIQIIIIEKYLRVTRRFLVYKPNIDRIKKMLKFSGPLCISTISYWLLSGFTKLIINQTFGVYENGIFAVANSLANIAIIAVNVFQFAWNETAYMIADEDNRKYLYRKSINLLFITVMIGYTVMSIMVKIIFPYTIGSEYSRASDIVPILMLGVSANAIAGFLGTLFMTEKKTVYILTSTIFAACINILFSKMGATLLGIHGVVFVLTFSFVFLMMLRLVYLRKNFDVGMNPVCYVACLPVIISFFLYKYVTSIVFLIFYVLVIIIIYMFIIQKFFGGNLIQRLLRRE